MAIRSSTAVLTMTWRRSPPTMLRAATRWPTRMSAGCGPVCGPSLEHRPHDPGIARAAAQIAAQVTPHLWLGWMRVRVEQRLGRHQHPGRAEAALDAAFLQERRLQRMHPAVDGEA